MHRQHSLCASRVLLFTLVSLVVVYYTHDGCHCTVQWLPLTLDTHVRVTRKRSSSYVDRNSKTSL